MFRVPLYLLALIALAFGVAWLVDRPGEIMLTWEGYRIETSVLVMAGIVLALVAALMIIWSLLRFAFGLPPALSVANRARRRERGYAALSRGIIAVGRAMHGLPVKPPPRSKSISRESLWLCC